MLSASLMNTALVAASHVPLDSPRFPFTPLPFVPPPFPFSPRSSPFVPPPFLLRPSALPPSSPPPFPLRPLRHSPFVPPPFPLRPSALPPSSLRPPPFVPPPFPLRPSALPPSSFRPSPFVLLPFPLRPSARSPRPSARSPFVPSALPPSSPPPSPSTPPPVPLAPDPSLLNRGASAASCSELTEKCQNSTCSPARPHSLSSFPRVPPLSPAPLTLSPLTRRATASASAHMQTRPPTFFLPFPAFRLFPPRPSPLTPATSHQASDRFNISSQLEHMQARYVGTGHADTTKYTPPLSHIHAPLPLSLPVACSEGTAMPPMWGGTIPPAASLLSSHSLPVPLIPSPPSPPPFPSPFPRPSQLPPGACRDWAVNTIHRDSYASYVGHHPLLAYFPFTLPILPHFPSSPSPFPPPLPFSHSFPIHSPCPQRVGSEHPQGQLRLLLNIHRDSYASYVGHHPLLAFHPPTDRPFILLSLPPHLSPFQRVGGEHPQGQLRLLCGAPPAAGLLCRGGE
ncbi:unnamed protein product [Closterium sp. Naga37s-1]|nr:unnamed protein product [Closterium sp. Naga37s-1]